MLEKFDSRKKIFEKGNFSHKFLEKKSFRNGFLNIKRLRIGFLNKGLDSIDRQINIWESSFARIPTYFM